jgi:uncharacterized protein (DUF488 family)
MHEIPLYTIGHGTRQIGEFLEALKSFGIQYLIDVRSRPYSRFNPQYNQKALKESLESNNIKYVFMGDSLGGRPSDPTCYDAEGKVDYEKIKAQPIFQQGIERLKTAYHKNIPVAIMCSESKPTECHRSKLIGNVLDDDKISLAHIDEKYNIKTQAELQGSLFISSRKKAR